MLQRKRQPRPGARLSLLGDGLLERIRSTTFALLGLTAAVGLALIAVVLQGDWPLIAGSPIPRAPVARESIGDATALGAAKPHAGGRLATVASGRRASSGRGRVEAPADEPGASPPTVSTELVSSPAAPVGHQGGEGNAPHGSPPGQGHASPTPQSTPPANAPATEPAHSPASGQPAPSEPSAPEPSPPEAVASEAPPSESNVPPWSNGKGHAYGRDDDGEHGHRHD